MELEGYIKGAGDHPSEDGKEMTELLIVVSAQKHSSLVGRLVTINVSDDKKEIPAKEDVTESEDNG